jgi:hypothetical protein
VQVVVHGAGILVVAWVALQIHRDDVQWWEATIASAAVLGSLLFQFFVFHRESGDPRPFHRYLRDPAGVRDGRP